MTCKDCDIHGICPYEKREVPDEEYKLKVGDRVKRVDTPITGREKVVEVGEKGAVVGYSGRLCVPYIVKWDNGEEFPMNDTFIELITKKTARKPKTRRICHFCIDEETVEDMRCDCGFCSGVRKQVQCPVCKEWFTVGTEFFLDEHGICMQCFDEWTDKHIDDLAEKAIAEAHN